MNSLLEEVLSRIIAFRMHRREALTPKEQRAQDAFQRKLQIIRRKTSRPIIVAMVGTTGSGKSSVARELAPLISATIIEGDAVRVHLRHQGERYEGARKIAENAAFEVLSCGGNVIMDSDHIDPIKRASLRAKARQWRAEVLFLRTYAERDILIGRLLAGSYNRVEFFWGATTPWQGGNHGTVVALREMWRRTPWHYHWSRTGGGRWQLRRLRFASVEVETTDPEHWPRQVAAIAERILGGA